MRAGFLRRLFSALVDLTIIIGIVYLAFIAVGRNLLQNTVENYDEVNENYENVEQAFDVDKATIDQEYETAKALAGDNQDAVNEAYLVYRNKLAILNQHFAQDTSVYQRLMYDYNVGSIYFYTIGIGLLMGILVLSLKGQTPGRRLLRIELVGQVTYYNIIVHDLLLKYLFMIALLLLSPYFAFILIPGYVIIDIFMIMLTKDKTTIRDRLSKIMINVKEKEISTENIKGGN